MSGSVQQGKLPRGRASGRPRARALGIALVLLATTAESRRALAAPTQVEQVVEGRVVAFELGDLVVDIAKDRGAQSGMVLELWRPISIKHPVTGQVVSDRFLIGHLRLTQVRGALSLARVDGKALQPAQAGDIVVFRHAVLPGVAAPQAASSPAAGATVTPGTPTVAPGTAVTPTAPAITPEASPAVASERALEKPGPSETGPSAPLEADAAAVSALFESLRGASLVKRIVAYEAYVVRRPRSRYAPTLYEEAMHLRRLLNLERNQATRDRGLRNFEAPREARAHSELAIAIELSAVPVAALLHSRHAGEVAYRSERMTQVGKGYFSATIAADRMRAPRLEYFVEGVNAAGESLPVLGSAEQPESVRVADVPTPETPPRQPATVSLSTDYADWNNLKGNDVVWQTEGSFGMRFQDLGLRAARSGFGVYRGRGGSLAELDQQKLSGRSVGLTYGYLEGEWGLSHFTALIGRMVIGLEDDGVNGGAQALLRLGNDRETNLTIGAEVLGGIGVRGITELQLASFPRVPILFRTEVTNQPAGASHVSSSSDEGASRRAGEIGARAIAQVGYRFLPDLVVAVRGSYQGRTINHAGPGFGGAVSYQW